MIRLVSKSFDEGEGCEDHQVATAEQWPEEHKGHATADLKTIKSSSAGNDKLTFKFIYNKFAQETSAHGFR